MALFMGTVGIPLLGIMYGLDFEQFRSLVYVMVGTGGVCACIDFLYQIVTVLRAQAEVTLYYGAAFAFSVPVSMLLVNFAGLSGAVVGSRVHGDPPAAPAAAVLHDPPARGEGVLGPEARGDDAESPCAICREKRPKKEGRPSLPRNPN